MTDPSQGLRFSAVCLDYRFAVPSTCAPLVVAVGPLEKHSFLLLGRKPLATVRDEGTWTKRTRPMDQVINHAERRVCLLQCG